VSLLDKRTVKTGFVNGAWSIFRLESVKSTSSPKDSPVKGTCSDQASSLRLPSPIEKVCSEHLLYLSMSLCV
jgi:hypothetical protein